MAHYLETYILKQPEYSGYSVNIITEGSKKKAQLKDSGGAVQYTGKGGSDTKALIMLAEDLNLDSIFPSLTTTEISTSTYPARTICVFNETTSKVEFRNSSGLVGVLPQT